MNRRPAIAIVALYAAACVAPPASERDRKAADALAMEPAAPVSSCEDTCFYAFDGECDDGGPGHAYAVCPLGSDCADCGDRAAASDPLTSALAEHLESEARAEGYGPITVAGPGAPQTGCVGAWALSGAAIGEVASKSCWMIGLVSSATGAGVLVAGVCGFVDAVQLDAALGAVAGTIAGIAVCSQATRMPVTASVGYRFFDDTSASPTPLAEIGSRLRADTCPANNASEAGSECWMYFHYTNGIGFGGIRSTSSIQANTNGRVYLTWLPYSPAEAETSAFISSTTHYGRGDFVVAFRKTDAGVHFAPGTQWNELVHYGTLRFGRHIEVLYAGPNPF